MKNPENIGDVIKHLMDRVMTRVLVSDPFVKEEHKAAKPLYAALVPDQIFKGSHFERRFVTPFGGVWEKLTKVVADHHHGDCQVGHSVTGTIGDESLRRIQETLNKLEGKTKPNWDAELAYIIKGGGEPIPCTVICDIFITNKSKNECYAFELKAPLPNSDQTKVSKEKLFKLLAMNEKHVSGAFYALPYNPYGKRSDYSWSFPMRWFDMKTDQSVFIGDEYWDFVGGKGTYQNLITEINNLGKQYKERIYKEYLGIEPPKDIDDGSL